MLEDRNLRFPLKSAIQLQSTNAHDSSCPLSTAEADCTACYITRTASGTGLYELWKRGLYRNYPPDKLVDLVARVLSLLPPWVRVYRIQVGAVQAVHAVHTAFSFRSSHTSLRPHAARAAMLCAYTISLNS